MSDELERLARLHKEGVLNDEEFAKAKQKALSEPANAPDQNRPLDEAANRYVSFWMFVWAMVVLLLLILFFGLALPHWRQANDHRIFELRVPRD